MVVVTTRVGGRRRSLPDHHHHRRRLASLTAIAQSTFSPRSPPPLSLSSTEYLQLRVADLAKPTILASGFRLRQRRVRVPGEKRRRFDCGGSLRNGQRRCGGSIAWGGGRRVGFQANRIEITGRVFLWAFGL